MLGVFKENMDEHNYYSFKNDYELLYHLKKCQAWKEVYKLKKSSGIISKQLYDELHDKYSYNDYKSIVRGNKQVHALLQSTLLTKGIQQAYFLELYYTTEIYISFMIEYIFKQEIKNKTNIKIISNNSLDIIKKIDLILDNKPIQIKSYTFISCNELTTDRLKEYKNNKDMHFIFYSMEEDNIYFAEIGNKVLVPITDINDFTACLGKNNLTLKETIERVKAATA